MRRQIELLLFGITVFELVEFVYDLESRAELNLHCVYQMVVSNQTQCRAVDILRFELIRHTHSRNTAHEPKHVVAIPLARIAARIVNSKTR